jgi:hypothetical protein
MDNKAKFSLTRALVACCLAILLCSEASHSGVIVLGFQGEPKRCAFLIEGAISSQSIAALKADSNSIRSTEDCSLDGNGKKASSFIKDIVLRDSPGGDLAAAFQIMNLIRALELNTHLDTSLARANKCQSACALIFASGEQRHFTSALGRFGSRNNLLGIHKPDFVEGTYAYVDKERKLDEIKYQIIDFLSLNQIDPRFVISMFETPTSKMYFPELSDLLIWRVVSSLDLPSNFKSLNLGEFRSNPCKYVGNTQQARKDLSKLLEAYERATLVGFGGYKEKMEKAISNVLTCLGVNETS